MILRDLLNETLEKIQFSIHFILSPAENNANIDSEDTFRTIPGNHSAPLVRKVRYFSSTDRTGHITN